MDDGPCGHQLSLPLGDAFPLLTAALIVNRQGVASVKIVVAGAHILRPVHGFQLGAFPKDILSHHRDGGQINGGQVGAAVKHLAIDGMDGVGQLHLRQSVAVGKGLAIEEVHRAGELHRGQAAAAEGPVADQLQGFGKFDGGQGCTVGKGVVADVLERAGQFHIRQSGTAGKGIVAQGGDAIAHLHPADVRLILVPRCGGTVQHGPGTGELQRIPAETPLNRRTVGAAVLRRGRGSGQQAQQQRQGCQNAHKPSFPASHVCSSFSCIRTKSTVRLYVIPV